MLKNLIRRSRSFRRFDEKIVIPHDTLRGFLDMARMTPSAKNLQPLKYVLVSNKRMNNAIFNTLAWAGYLKDWEGPAEGERPTSYIIMLGDRRLTDDYNVDPGIAAQTIMLAAAESGYGGCIIGSVDRIKLAEILDLPDHFDIIQVLALGQPAEKVVIEEAREGNIVYWRDQDNLHHVPKRRLDEIIIKQIGNE